MSVQTATQNQPPSAPDWRGQVVGQFRLIDALGVGSLGSVYLGEDTKTRRRVALKALPLNRIKEGAMRTRFDTAAKIIGGLNHHNLVKVFGILKLNRVAMMVMEHLPGNHLQQVVQEHGPMSPSRAARSILQAAHGLHAAHQAGLVHRGVKPSNLLLDRQGNVKVADLGLTEFFPKRYDNETKFFNEKHLRATAAFLAPELGLGDSADLRADIYSLGATFYFLLSGQELFPTGSLAQILLAHQRREPTHLSELRPEIPEGMVQIVHQMIAKNPDDRYSSMSEIVTALARYNEQHTPPPSQALTPTAIDRARTMTGPAHPGNADKPPRNLLPYVFIGGGILTIAGLIAAMAMMS